jgi:hypothetical protein
MPPNEEAHGAWLLGRALDWQVTAAELALTAPLLAWRTGLALVGGWVEAVRPVPGPEPDGPVPQPEAAAKAPMAEEVDHLA